MQLEVVWAAETWMREWPWLSETKQLHGGKCQTAAKYLTSKQNDEDKVFHENKSSDLWVMALKLKPVRAQVLPAKATKLTLANVLHAQPLNMKLLSDCTFTSPALTRAAHTTARLVTEITGCSHRLSALEEADSQTLMYRYRCPVVTWLTGARSALRYVPVCGRRSPQCGPEAASGAVHANGAQEPLIPVSLWRKQAKCVSASGSPSSPSASKAHGVLSASDLPTVHCVNC